MRPTCYTVDHPGPGRLSTMAKPRAGDWLADEMADLAAAGTDILVCALTVAELVELDLTGEAQAAYDAGLHFVSIPIPDRGVPDLPAVMPTLEMLATRFQNGAHIVTHCRFGIGRASLLAAAILTLSDVTPDEAWSSLERARGLAVPDTVEQRHWVARLRS
jgi:protein-tyrosine phosphatase